MANILGYVNYTTEAGDNWGLIAYKAYGDVQQMPLLIASNRAAGIPVIFSAGVNLLVPVLAGIDLLDPQLLPPWKRS